jgi:hypothetical protein
VPELQDAQLRVAGGDAVDRAQHGRHTLGRGVRLALHREEDDRGAAVVAHLPGILQRRADVGDAAGRVNRGDDVADGVSPRRAQDVAMTPDLHEHLLGGGPLEPGALERPARGGRLPVAGLGAGQLLAACAAADGGHQQHEHEPTHDRRRPMPGAPAPGPRRDSESGGGPHGLSPSSAMD